MFERKLTKKISAKSALTVSAKVMLRAKSSRKFTARKYFSPMQ